MQKNIWNIMGAAGVGIALSALFVFGVAEAAPLATNGWAWSDVFGWLHFNSGSSPVGIDSVTGNFSGYAWSSNAGWIEFAPTGPFPAAPNYSAKLDLASKQASGWARILSLRDYNGSGWVKLRGSQYGVNLNTTTCKLTGWAWSSELGWIHFDGSLYSVEVNSSLCAGPSKPDLIPQPITINGTLTTGTTLTFTGKVKNESTTAKVTKDSKGRWCINSASNTSCIDSADGRIGSASSEPAFGAFNPNQTSSNRTSLGWIATAGPNKIWWCADVYDSVDESSNSNNCTSKSFTVAPPLANEAACLGITAPASVAKGQSFSASVAIKNTGTKTWTSDAPTPHKLGSQNSPANLWGLTHVDLPGGTAVAPGSSVTFSFTPKAPSAVGSYNFIWMMLEESVEWFEQGCMKTIKVTAVANKPDLTISAGPGLNTGSLTSGQVVTFKGTVTNNGTAAAGGTFNNRFEIDLNNSTFTTADTTLTPHPTITTLTGGASSQVFSGNWTATNGEHTIRLCADRPPDPDGSVSESDETDLSNCAIWQFAVTAAPVNGSCGSADGISTATAPASNLCSVGTPTSVTQSGSNWTWQCLGSGGGSDASCSAPIAIPPPVTNAQCTPPQVFGNPQSLGGAITGAAVEHIGTAGGNDDRLIIAARGTNGNVYALEWKNGVLKNWYSVNGGSTVAIPKLVHLPSGSNNPLWMYVQGTNGNIYKTKYLGPGSWSSWTAAGPPNSSFGSSGPNSVATSWGGPFQVTVISGNAGAIQACTVSTTGDFSLQASRNIISVIRPNPGEGIRASDTSIIAVVPTGGFSKNVVLDVASGLPSPIDSHTFSPPVTLLPAQYATGAGFKVVIQNDTPLGDFPITIRGVSGSLTRIIPVTLRIVNFDVTPF